MREIEFPPEFEELAHSFYQLSVAEYDTMEAWIAGCVDHRFFAEQRAFMGFLDHLLDGDYTDEELADVWQRTNPSYGFSRGGHRVFFRMIRDRLAENLARASPAAR